MTELEKYQRVNSCETQEELIQCILDFAEDGFIQGRVRKFDAQKMAENAFAYLNNKALSSPNTITREFGIRQQAIYLKYYGL